MHNFMFNNYSNFGFSGGFGFLFVLLVIWTLVWKGLALWRAARRGEQIWFVVLLIVNTLGILDILYLYVFSRDKQAKTIVEDSSAGTSEGGGN